MPPDEAMQVEGSSVDERFVVRRLFAGGQHSFASITASSEVGGGGGEGRGGRGRGVEGGRDVSV